MSRGQLFQHNNRWILGLTGYDGVRQTFRLVKFFAPQFFLEILLGLWPEIGISEISHPRAPWRSQGAFKGFWGAKQGNCPPHHVFGGTFFFLLRDHLAH